MGDKLLKEIEKGSKLAVMKKRIITHYIIMVVLPLLIWQKKWI